MSDRPDLQEELRPQQGRSDIEDQHGAFLDSILSASLCGIYVYNVVEGRNEYINAQYTNITGWSLDEINTMSSKDFAELFHPDERDAVFAHMHDVMHADSRQPFEIEYRFRSKDGKWIWCLSRDAVFDWAQDRSVRRFIGTFLDISDRKHNEVKQREMEARLQQTQRLESLGVLSGGIAHDFNNILMAIMGHADLALAELSPLSPSRESITEIKTASVSASELCGQLLAYSGKGRLERQDLALEELVGEMLHMLRTCIPKNCMLNLNMAKDLPSVHGDPSQLRQVIMNLVINAAEAIGERSGGVTLSTDVIQCTQQYLIQNFIGESLLAGPYMCLEVADTGCGMDRETMQRVFEPFYTTKFTGRGLGLSAVMGIVQSHGGALRVYSEEGKGTTFKILLPVSETTETNSPAPDASPKWRGIGQVLLVDDEQSVRDVSRMLLRHLGFDVLTANDGQQGVDLYREHASEIAMVLLDLTMPIMDGKEAYRNLRELNPNVIVVLASGYNEHDIGSRFAGKGIAGFLQKPYSLNKLRILLSTLLPEAKG